MKAGLLRLAQRREVSEISDAMNDYRKIDMSKIGHFSDHSLLRGLTKAFWRGHGFALHGARPRYMSNVSALAGRHLEQWHAL